MFNHSDTLHKCNGQTERQENYYSTHCSLALASKNISIYST